MAYNINIEELFQNQFGVKPQLVFDNKLYGMTQLLKLKRTEVEFGEVQANRTSIIGTPVWDYISIKPKVIEGTGEEFPGYEFPLEIITEVVLPMKKVETDIVGRDGNVEELMGVEDWMITVRGFVINHDSKQYPEELVKELRAFAALKDTLLDVESTFLNLLDIFYVSVHRLSFPPGTGYSNVQPFEMELKSKLPFTVNAEDGILL